VSIVTNPPPSVTPERDAEQREFLLKYWNSLMTPDWDAFASLVAENCVVHYPGNHFLSGDHVGRKNIVTLYQKLHKLGIEQGTFVGEFHDAVTSNDHACALITYRIVITPGREIPGQAVGVFHIENGQMVEYWLLERDQKMINDVVKMSGKAALAGGGNLRMAIGALTHPAALVRTLRRVRRYKENPTGRML
jgi:ketosteroid isomerase-like protein